MPVESDANEVKRVVRKVVDMRVRRCLEKTLDLSVVVEADVVVTRAGRETGKGLDVSAEGVDEAGSGREADLADWEGETCKAKGAGKGREGSQYPLIEQKKSKELLTSGDTLARRLMRERERGLGHADREVGEALASVSLDLGASLIGDVDTVGAVHPLSNGLNLVLDRGVDIVEVLEVVVLLASLDDGIGEVDGALTTLSPVVRGDGLVGSVGQSVLLDKSELGGSIVAGRDTSRVSKKLK